MLYMGRQVEKECQPEGCSKTVHLHNQCQTTEPWFNVNCIFRHNAVDLQSNTSNSHCWQDVLCSGEETPVAKPVNC